MTDWHTHKGAARVLPLSARWVEQGRRVGAVLFAVGGDPRATRLGTLPHGKGVCRWEGGHVIRSFVRRCLALIHLTVDHSTGRIFSD